MKSGAKKVIIAALIGNSLIAISKFIAAAVTQSSAMFAEGIHSVVDTGNQLLLLYGIHRASRPPDAEFPFGYGKELYFWSFVVAILIFSAGAGLSAYEGVHQLLDPSVVKDVHLNYIVLLAAMIFEGAAWYYAFREFEKVRGPKGYISAVRRAKDPSIFVVLFEDSAAMLGLGVAFLGILLSQVTGFTYFDGVASIVIGLILGSTAIWLAYETKGLLIGESASSQVVQGIRELAKSQRGVRGVNEVLTLHMGADFILVNISIDFIEEVSARDLERIVSELDARIKRKYSAVKRVFIEAESRRSTGAALGESSSQR